MLLLVEFTQDSGPKSTQDGGLKSTQDGSSNSSQLGCAKSIQDVGLESTLIMIECGPPEIITWFELILRRAMNPMWPARSPGY